MIDVKKAQFFTDERKGRYFSNEFYPHIDKHGDVDYGIAIVRDITKQKKEEQQKINSLQKKEQEKKNKKLQEEKQKLDQIYHSLDPDKQKEIDLEAEKRLDDFWKSQLNKEKSKGKLSKILQAALDEKRREIIKNWYIINKRNY